MTNPNFVKRRNYLHRLFFSLFICFLFFVWPGCKKSSAVYSPLAFSPQYDTLAGTVTFTGISFDPSGSNNQVFFNGATDNSAPAQVVTASASELTVIVPSYALSGKVNIKVGGNSYTTQGDFLLAPTFFPLSAAVSYPVNIYGNGFSSVISENLVRFNGTVAKVIAATNQQLTVLVPQFATPGPIVVTSNLATAPSLINFTPAPTGNVSTLAGSGEDGAVDDIGAAASFNQPYGLCADSLGNIYVADFGNHKIRKISTTGAVTTFAGNGNFPDADGQLLSASIYGPTSIGTVNGDSNRIYVTESLGNRIRFITNDTVTTLVNSNIPATIYSQPMGLSIDTTGNLFFANFGDSNVVQFTPSQQVTVIASAVSPVQGYPAQVIAPLSLPSGTAVDIDGNLYITDMRRNLILKITSTGTLSTFAGSGVPGTADGLGTAAQFSHPTSLCVDISGNLYVVDQGNNEIRRITPDGYVTTLAGSSTQNVSADGGGSAAGFNSPFGITIDKNGILYVSDAGGNKIRKITVR
jgi:sugar lactone lactonase YvrE